MRRPIYYVLDRLGVPVAETDPMAFGHWFATADRRVAHDVPAPDIEVSTVFTGIDHSYSAIGEPVLWETMVFRDGGHDGALAQRYTSLADAKAGHLEICRELRGRASREGGENLPPRI